MVSWGGVRWCHSGTRFIWSSPDLTLTPSPSPSPSFTRIQREIIREGYIIKNLPNNNMSILNTGYVLGTAFIGLGVYPFLRRSPLPYIGQPLPLLSKDEATLAAASTSEKGDDVSRLVESLLRAKGGRDVAIGLMFLAHEGHGDDMATGTLMMLVGLVDLADGVQMWWRGGEEGRKKAVAHWVSGVTMAVLSWRKLGLGDVIASRWGS